MRDRLATRLLLAGYHVLGRIAHWARLRTTPGRWYPASNDHRYPESW